MRSGVWYRAALQGFRRLQILPRGEHVCLLISDSLPSTSGCFLWLTLDPQSWTEAFLTGSRIHKMYPRLKKQIGDLGA